jgi:hypothetical protein
MPPLIGGGAKQKANNRCSFLPSTTASPHCLQGQSLHGSAFCCGTVLRVRFPSPQTEPQTDLPEAHLLEKEEVQEKPFFPSFPRRTRLPTTKSISSEPLYHDLSSTVPTYLRSPPSLESVFICPAPLRHHQPPASFSANRLQSPSRVPHHRLSTRDSDLSYIRDALSE